METRLTQLVFVCLLVASASYPALLTASSPATASMAACESAYHTSFRSDAAIAAVNESGEAMSTTSNTQVTVEDTSGFIRIHADNPNGYCVEFTVEISPEIVSPADLGEIDSNDEETTADWRATQNLSSGEVYTQVTFQLSGNDSATFAPSKVRVHSLSWTGETREASSSLFNWSWGSDDLEKRTYTIEPTGNSSRITVPLKNESGGEIEEWQATYTAGGETKPVTQDANAPVFYTESESSVTFHFNDRDARVTFTAEPTGIEKIQHDATSYFDGWDTIGSWFGVATPTEVDR